MSTTFQRSPLTNHLLHWIKEHTSFEVGDAVIPKNAGWQKVAAKPQPNAPGGTFTPYTVLTSMTAVPAPGTGSIAETQQDWHIPYVIQSFGVTREQSERLADKVRISIGELTHEILELKTDDAPQNRYRVQQVWFPTIGGGNVTPGSDPMFYGEQDQFVLWLAKRQPI